MNGYAEQITRPTTNPADCNMLPVLSTPLSSTGPDFVPLDSIPEDLRWCRLCKNDFSTSDDYRHYPVRLPCGNVYCYQCMDTLLSVSYQHCPGCGECFEHPLSVHASVHMQIQRCQQHMEPEDLFSRLSAEVQQGTIGRSPEWTEDAVTSVEAALALLDLEPDTTVRVNSDDVQAALALMDLPMRNLEDVGGLIHFLCYNQGRGPPQQASELEEDIETRLRRLGLF